MDPHEADLDTLVKVLHGLVSYSLFVSLKKSTNSGGLCAKVCIQLEIGANGPSKPLDGTLVHSFSWSPAHPAGAIDLECILHYILFVQIWDHLSTLGKFATRHAHQFFLISG